MGQAADSNDGIPTGAALQPQSHLGNKTLRKGESLEQLVPLLQERAPWALSSMQNVRPLEEGMSLAPKGRGGSQTSDGSV